MSEELNTNVVDMVRWTFTAEASRRKLIEDYLSDLGLDVLIQNGAQFVALWDDPAADCDYDAVVEELWALNGAPFEITHESFSRIDLLVFHPEEPAADEPERAVA